MKFTDDATGEFIEFSWDYDSPPTPDELDDMWVEAEQVGKIHRPQGIMPPIPAPKSLSEEQLLGKPAAPMAPPSTTAIAQPPAAAPTMPNAPAAPQVTPQQVFETGPAAPAPKPVEPNPFQTAAANIERRTSEVDQRPINYQSEKVLRPVEKGLIAASEGSQALWTAATGAVLGLLKPKESEGAASTVNVPSYPERLANELYTEFMGATAANDFGRAKQVWDGLGPDKQQTLIDAMNLTSIPGVGAAGNLLMKRAAGILNRVKVGEAAIEDLAAIKPMLPKGLETAGAELEAAASKEVQQNVAGLKAASQKVADVRAATERMRTAGPGKAKPADVPPNSLQAALDMVDVRAPEHIARLTPEKQDLLFARLYEKTQTGTGVERTQAIEGITALGRWLDKHQPKFEQNLIQAPTRTSKEWRVVGEEVVAKADDAAANAATQGATESRAAAGGTRAQQAGQLSQYDQELVLSQAKRFGAKPEEIDHMTMLPGRNPSKAALEKAMADNDAVFYFDLDFSKDANEIFGHEALDKTFRVVGELVHSAFPDAKFMGRIGGEEFGVVIRPDQVESVKNFVDLVSKNLKVKDQRVTVSGGVGIGRSKTGKMAAEELAAKAKSSGRNQIIVDLPGQSSYTISGAPVGLQGHIRAYSNRAAAERLELLANDPEIDAATKERLLSMAAERRSQYEQQLAGLREATGGEVPAPGVGDAPGRGMEAQPGRGGDVQRRGRGRVRGQESTGAPTKVEEPVAATEVPPNIKDAGILRGKAEPEPVTPPAESPVAASKAAEPPPTQSGAKTPPPDEPPPQPPAAAAEGPEERSLNKTLEKAGFEGGTKRTYTPIPHKETEAAADAVIEERGIEGANQWLNKQSEPVSHFHVVAAKLIGHYQTQAEALAKTRPAEAAAMGSKAIDIANRASDRALKLGQEEEAIKIFGTLSPETILVTGTSRKQAAAKAAGSKVKPQLTATEVNALRGAAKKAQQAGTLADETKAMSELAGRMAKGETPSAADVAAMRAYHERLKTYVEEVVAKKAPSDKMPNPKKLTLMQSVAKMTDERAQKALARYNERHGKGPVLSAGPNADDMLDMADYGSAILAKGVIKSAQFAEEMAKTFGESVRPHIKGIYRRSGVVLSSERGLAQELRRQAEIIPKLLEKVDAQEGITPELAQEFVSRIQKIDELTGEARTEAIYTVQAALKNLVPSTFGEKASATQAMAQLLNPKTIVRNIVGNELLATVVNATKIISVPVDWAASKISGAARTKAFVIRDVAPLFGTREYAKGFVKGFRRTMKGLPTGDMQLKYDVKGNTFRSDAGRFEAVMAGLEKATGVGLRVTDQAALNRAMMLSLAESGELLAIARGVPQGQRKAFIESFIRNADPVSLKLAEDYGKYMTFSDDSFLAKQAVSLKGWLNKFNIKGFGMGELVLKYPRVPANLVNRAIDFSPIGFLNSMRYLVEAMPAVKGQWNQRAFVDAFTRATVGTVGLTGMGYYLYDKGIISASSESRNVEEFKKQQTGTGKYKVNVSALKRWVFSGFADNGATQRKEGDTMVSYDWALPLSISLSLGANVRQAMEEDARAHGSIGSAMAGFVDAASSGVETLAEQPLVTGIQQAFGQRGESAGERAMAGIKQILVSAPASFVPTLLNQVRQITDNSVRETNDPNPFKQALNKVIDKVPFVNQFLSKSYETLGASEKERYQNGSNTLYNVFLNPAFVSKYHIDPVVQAVLTPYEKEMRTEQVPRFAPRTVSFSQGALAKAGLNVADKAALEKLNVKSNKDQLSFKLTPDEYSQMQKFMGSYTEKGFNELVKGGTLNKMDAKDQEAALAKVIRDVAEAAKQQYLEVKLGKRKTMDMQAAIDSEKREKARKKLGVKTPEERRKAIESKMKSRLKKLTPEMI